MQLTLQANAATNKQHDSAGNKHANEQVVECALVHAAGNAVANKQPHQGSHRRHCVCRHVSLVKCPHLDVPEHSGADNQHDSIGGAYHFLQAALQLMLRPAGCSIQKAGGHPGFPSVVTLMSPGAPQTAVYHAPFFVLDKGHSSDSNCSIQQMHAAGLYSVCALLAAAHQHPGPPWGRSASRT